MNSYRSSGGSSVESLTRVKTLAYCVTLVLAQWGLVGVAHADSAVGPNTSLGNAANPAPVNPTAKQADGLDPEGMGGDLEKVSHTPSGQMYNLPNNDPEPASGKAATFHGSVEAGVVGVNGDNAGSQYRTYKDVKQGLAIESFSIQGEKPDAATYVEAVGGGVGRDDQFYGVQFGKYNDWKVKAFYNETPHVFSTDVKSIWDGVGTNHLTLKNGIPAGGGVTTVGQNFNATCTAQSGTGTTTGFTTPCFVAPAYGFNTPTTGAALTAAATTTTNGGVYAQETRQLMALQNNMGYSELSLIRKTGGLSLDTSLSDSWKVFATLTQEKRKGARPIGMTDSGFSDAMETVEPIDFTTTDFKAGVRYRDRLTQFNVIASANLFHNANSSMTVDNPFLAGVTASTVLEKQGVFSLPPSNQAYGILGEFARNLPEFMNGRFNATASWNTSRQHEPLMPFSSLSGQGTLLVPPVALGSFNGNYNQWNTSLGDTDARIDTKLLDVKLSLQPLKDLSVAGKVRYFSTDNKTTFLDCNPNATYGDGTKYTAWGCTGVWGYMGYDYNASLLNNKGVTSGYIPTAAVAATATTAAAVAGLPSNKWLRNIPWDRKELTPAISADYRLNNFSSVNGSFEREDIERRNRERDKTWEDKLKIGYTNRAIEDGTLRLSYEHDRRRGSDYNPSPYIAQFSGLAFINPAAIPAGTALGGYFVTIGDLRKSEFADRDQNILNARVNYALRAGLDLGGSYQWKTSHYDESTVGRQKQDLQSLGLDLNYVASPDQIWYANYGYQEGKFRQANVQNGRPAAQAASFACNMGQATPWGVITADNAVAICDTLANNITWAPINAATVDSNDTNHVFGLGLKLGLGNKLLDVNFTHTAALTTTSYSYDPTGTTIAAANQALAGSGMPDNTHRSNVLSASLKIPVSKQMSIRLAAAVEDVKITDWHYTGLSQNMVTGVQANPIYIDAGPQNYRVTMIGIMLQYKM